MLAGSIVLALFVCAAVWSVIVNPFHRFSRFRAPYSAKLHPIRGIRLIAVGNLYVMKNPLHRAFAYFASALYIFFYALPQGGRLRKRKIVVLPELIRAICRKRFHTGLPYLISGDHFFPLYPRSLGVFYAPAFDPRTALDQEEWDKRQMMLAKTTVFALDVFARAGDVFTTVVPVGRRAVIPINIYSYPSDTLYSMLFGLQSLMTSKESAKIYPFTYSPRYLLLAGTESHRLLTKYRGDLRRLFAQYLLTVFDPATGLVTMKRHFSGTKDITRRRSSFYDNVILWRTIMLGKTLDVLPQDYPDPDRLKQRILTTFWMEKEGYFLEDLSPESQQDRYYSSDWLVSQFTGFLSPAKKDERHYFSRSVEYIRRTRLAEPFPLRYHADDRRSRQFLPVRIFLPSYGGSAIWSLWGWEYIKLLIRMYAITGEKNYRTEAIRHVHSYEQVMIRDNGFPEVYNRRGGMLHTPFYRSVRQTGWVVHYLQATRMLESMASRTHD